MFTFSILTPDDGSFSCRASLLVFDNELKILADPSWNGKNVDDILFLEEHLKQVDLILLSHSTPEFIGGYVLLCVKFPALMSNIPIYSTLPVNQLGRISTVEYYRSSGVLGPVNSAIMEIVDVDEWFDKIKPLKYFQTLSLLENRLVLTPYNAGHTLGGTFWLICKRLEKIIYAPAWNHSKDSFLNGASFLSSTTGNPLSSLVRPTALITNTDLGSVVSHKKRTEKFLQLVDATLANGGAVLLPTTLSGRFFELLHLVDEHLQGAPIPVYFLSFSGTKVLNYASNLAEWMSTQLAKEFEDSSATSDSMHHRHPFDATKVDLLLNANELIQLVGPKIVFASGMDLNNGDISTEAFQCLCQDEKTTIILTEKSHFGYDDTIGSQLYDEWSRLAKQKQNSKTPEDGVAVPLEKAIPLKGWTKEEPLSSEERAEFEQRINIQRKQKLLAKVREKKNESLLNTDMLNADDSSSEDESENSSEDEEGENQLEKAAVAAPNEPDSAAAAIVNQLSAHDTLVADHVKKALESNAPLDIKITYKLRPRQAMFPFINNAYKQKFDDYGEVIDPKNFQRNDDSANTKLIMESKKKFEMGDRRDGKGGRGKNGDKNKNNQNKLTPQEQLNNQVLQRNLETLYNPSKRVPLNVGSAFANLPPEIRARCGLSFVDLSGVVDIRSLNLIVSLLKPYNLLLMPDFTNSSGAEETDGLKLVKSVFDQQQEEQKMEHTKFSIYNSSRFMSLATVRSGLQGFNSQSTANQMNILALSVNCPVEIGGDGSGVGLSDFEVKLDDKLLESLKWQKISGSYNVAQVYGELEIRNNQAVANKKQKTVADYINPSTEFSLKYLLKADYLKKEQKLLGSSSRLNENGPKLAIGDIRLPELKKKLISRNLNAEFKSEGTLVVNDTIAIRKVTYSGIEGDDTGDIVIDGQIGSLYYQVKDCIREMLAYV